MSVRAAANVYVYFAHNRINISIIQHESYLSYGALDEAQYDERDVVRSERDDKANCEH